MAILNFVKPDKVVMINSTETEGQFEFRPLEPGFGISIGKSLFTLLVTKNLLLVKLVSLLMGSKF